MLFLIRHAHTDYSPDEMRGLSVSGHAAAQRVANLLARCDVSRIVSSPYTRAVQTVQPLAERLGLPVHIEPDLRERKLCAEVVDDAQRRLEVLWRDFDFCYAGGESSTAAQARVRDAIDRIAQQANGRNVAIASHGNALASFLRTLDPRVDFSFWARMSMPDVYAVEELEGLEGAYRRIWTP
jgi:2,3-bisphosphoglycerate-dependent phosphoglycerate mutase